MPFPAICCRQRIIYDPVFHCDECVESGWCIFYDHCAFIKLSITGLIRDSELWIFYEVVLHYWFKNQSVDKRCLFCDTLCNTWAGSVRSINRRGRVPERRVMSSTPPTRWPARRSRRRYWNCTATSGCRPPLRPRTLRGSRKRRINENLVHDASTRNKGTVPVDNPRKWNKANVNQTITRVAKTKGLSTTIELKSFTGKLEKSFKKSFNRIGAISTHRRQTVE